MSLAGDECRWVRRKDTGMRTKVIRDGYAYYDDPRGSSHSPPIGYPVDAGGNVVGSRLSICHQAPIVQEGGASYVRSIFQATDAARSYTVDVCVQCGARCGEVVAARSGMIDGRTI